MGALHCRCPSASTNLLCLLAARAGAPQKRRAVKLSGDSKLFEAGQLGSTPGGGSLTTYKELCSLATELGQPDLGGSGAVHAMRFESSCCACGGAGWGAASCGAAFYCSPSSACWRHWRHVAVLPITPCSCASCPAVFRFMEIANSQAAINSSRGAAFGQAWGMGVDVGAGAGPGAGAQVCLSLWIP